jgi:hypothetical protein
VNLGFETKTLRLKRRSCQTLCMKEMRNQPCVFQDIRIVLCWQAPGLEFAGVLQAFTQRRIPPRKIRRRDVHHNEVFSGDGDA